MYHDDGSDSAYGDGAAQNPEWMKRQLAEAITAGERAIGSLTDARGKLDSARNWGIFDMLGGGFLSSMIKHAKMEGASEDLRRAQRDLEVFQDELRDVDVMLDVDLEIDGFLSFADLFMDSFFADALVQDKISRARKQAEEGISRTQSIVRALKEKYRTL